MGSQKCTSSHEAPSLGLVPLNFLSKVHEKAQLQVEDRDAEDAHIADVDIDLSEVYFLIMHFLSSGPCQRTFIQLWNELLEHKLLPRRYHAWYSRSGEHSGDENDNGISFPVSYNKLVDRYPHIEPDHLVSLLKQLMLRTASPLRPTFQGGTPSAADVPTLLGTGSFSLLGNRNKEHKKMKRHPAYLHWPHIQADHFRGLCLREIGGGFTKHHRAPSIRAACYAIAKPSTMVQKMKNIKKLRGHRTAVYCAIFDRSGRYVITGSDDRLVKIWSMETAFCLASCRGHEGDITDLAVSSNNALVASASNDFIIRVWRLPDGCPISVLQGHTGAVTAIAFSPRASAVYQLLSSSDDGTCRIWDARYSTRSPRIYVPKSPVVLPGRSNTLASSNTQQNHQILCCAYNASGTIFVSGSSDTFARVWNAYKVNIDDSEQPNHEMDVLSGHENDVNYVQFSGCAVAPRHTGYDLMKEENIPKFRSSWFSLDYIVTCSRDGTAIIWIPRSRKSHRKDGKWMRAYHLKVPPPPMPPRPPRGGPRQRLLPTPRGVNMIVWSLDNRFVLAAIMDCRICVWNAVDGSLVHSLTGHSESTYVLDVHPFNPRMALSAGYDGKTILWDIWEGTPIRIFEIGRVKLVDGKFSPDGTSIVLSDDVGQIYLLNTGQGESHKDAKYDQFFLGDYRPLLRDATGSLLDQETQLPPHTRNKQDPLCDSSLIPYPEPYQSMYQKRRLGALGIEWRPLSVNLAVGPDINLGLEYYLPPLPDLERIIEPGPEFIDIMNWEPENEVISDDTDSEYNATEDCSSDGGPESLTGSSSESNYSIENSEVGCSRRDGFRRSKRKKDKAKVDPMSSSGRHIKKRSLSESDGSLSGINRTKRQKNGRKNLKKSSKAKISRPQRITARNAKTMSYQSDTSTDGGYLDSSSIDSSESDSMLHEDPSVDTGRNMQYVQQEQPNRRDEPSNGFDDACEGLKLPESKANDGRRKRLVLKFSLPESKQCGPLEVSKSRGEKEDELVKSSSPPETVEESSIKFAPGESGAFSANANLVSSKKYNRIKFTFRGQAKNNEAQLGTYGDYRSRSGEVNASMSNHLTSADWMTREACAGSSRSFDVHNCNENSVNKDDKPQDKGGNLYPHSENQSGGNWLRNSFLEGEQLRADEIVARGFARNIDLNLEDAQKSPSFQCLLLEDFQQRVNVNHGNGSSMFGEEGNYDLLETEKSDDTNNMNVSKGDIPIRATKIKIRSNRISRDTGSPSKFKSIMEVEDQTGDDLDMVTKRLPSTEQDQEMGIIEDEEGTARSSRLRFRMDPNNKIYDSVSTRTRLMKTVNEKDGFGSDSEDSYAGDPGYDAEIVLPKHANEGVRRTRSMAMKPVSRDPYAVSNEYETTRHQEPAGTSKGAERSSGKFRNQLISRDMLPSSMISKSRSNRNRRERNSESEPANLTGRKFDNPAKKVSWLLLSEHEEFYRYIPQRGDEVVYLCQGHQEYMESSGSSTGGSWRSFNCPVESCKVEDLDYSTHAGSGESCCKITLRVTDPSSSVFGKVFHLTLPELIDFPDFIVERTRYDAAMERNWTTGDKCLVWWRNQNGEGGSWWEGQIVGHKMKSNEFPDSPWERYTVEYDAEPNERHQHSPWELHDPGVYWEHPCVDFNIKNELLDHFFKLERAIIEKEDCYGIQKLKEVSERKDFSNRFPVPLSPDIIKARLENNYYRSLEAAKHDITVMLSNAQSYLGKNPVVRMKMDRLSNRMVGW
ncbi:Bromodomain [Dillenia turbinata]|uniref:Bromodomain n=1 Tax=Dillenia turbinata TaxID=194707 RepID=A0AAN8VW78_9MAGN